MAFTSTPVAGGTTGTLADSAPAIDRVSSVDYQRVKLAEATEGSILSTGIDSNPLKVKARRRGALDYDSGRVAALGTLTAITTATVYPEVIFLTNVSATQRWVTVTNTADAEWLSQYPVAPRSTVILRPSPLEMVGLKAQAEAVSAIVIHVAGGQA